MTGAARRRLDESDMRDDAATKPRAVRWSAMTPTEHAKSAVRVGAFQADAEVTVSPAGLLAVGGLVAAILLATAVLVRAAKR
jgi:hypothetical protein